MLFDRDPLWMIVRNQNESATDQQKYWYFKKNQDQEAFTSPSSDQWQGVFDSSATVYNSVGTTLRPPEFLDQIMPLNLVLLATNEYGVSAYKALIGVEIK